MIQSLIAVGTGGITGLGLMEGKQKLFYLPEPHTDFIFAVIGEELGLVGAGAFAQQQAAEGNPAAYVFAVDTFVSADSPI